MEHICCLTVLWPRYFVFDRRYNIIETTRHVLVCAWNPDMGTHSILETAVHFEPLIAAELAPRCRIGVAWVCLVCCESSTGVVDLGISHISSYVVIDEDRTALSVVVAGKRLRWSRGIWHAARYRGCARVYPQRVASWMCEVLMISSPAS